MPESRGGGTSGGEGRSSSSAWSGTGHTPSWRMEGAEEDGEGSSGKTPDIPHMDLRGKKNQEPSDLQVISFYPLQSPSCFHSDHEFSVKAYILTV